MDTTVDRAVAELRQLRPRWEGLHSFDKVWDATVTVGLEAGVTAARRPPGSLVVYSARHGIARRTARVMRKAHPINFGRAQLLAIRDICADDGASPFEFLREHRAAFDMLFLDYSDVAASPTMLPDGPDWDIELYAATYHRHSEDAVTIVPFGTRVFGQDDDRSTQWTPGIVGDDGEVWQLPEAAALGSLMVVELDDETKAEGEAAPFVARFTVAEDESEMRALIPVRCLPGLLRDYFPEAEDGPYDYFEAVSPDVVLTVGGQPDMRGLVEHGALPQPEARTMFRDLPEKAVRSMVADAVIVLHQALAVMDSLYFLDAHNVTIEDARVSRQVRRRAERSGGEIQIAQTVRVGPTKVKRNASPSKGGTANYSHRFERRGYTRHVTKGSHAKADLLRPCYRRDAEGNLTCPNGCRREWVPPTIVGGEDLPFVPKTRVLPGPTMEN